MKEAMDSDALKDFFYQVIEKVLSKEVYLYLSQEAEKIRIWKKKNKIRST